MHKTSLHTLLAAYDWFDHPDGPKFVETHRDQYRTSGHWLFQPGRFSSFHRVLGNEELWLVHLGRLIVHVIDPGGHHSILNLGLDLSIGETPVAAVRSGYWQAAELPDSVPFAFGTNICAPPFSFDAFELGQRDALLIEYPQHAALIQRLTR